jgi:hypothetical protein
MLVSSIMTALVYMRMVKINGMEILFAKATADIIRKNMTANGD